MKTAEKFSVPRVASLDYSFDFVATFGLVLRHLGGNVHVVPATLVLRPTQMGSLAVVEAMCVLYMVDWKSYPLLVHHRSKSNKAKTVAVEAKPEVEIWRRPKKSTFDHGFLFAPSDSFELRHIVSPQYKMSQTDRQMTHCAKGTTDSTIGQKRANKATFCRI